jgi:cytochrome c
MPLYRPEKVMFFSWILILLFIPASLGWMGWRTPYPVQQPNQPEENRFSKQVLSERLDEPVAMAFLPGSKVLFVERKGTLRMYDPKTRTVKLIANIPVNTTYLDERGRERQAEEGLMGIVVHPSFEKNHWIYLYYADPLRPVHVLARWNLVDERLDPGSKKVMLEIPVRREEFCCTGGGMTFDKSGNLFLSVGTNAVFGKPDSASLGQSGVVVNTNEPETAGNTNDLRGKIIRIRPEDNGRYSIPEGNLFPKGMPGTRPEIYVMGTRNPWRISIDSKTGYLYWGDPGRDEEQRHVVGTRGFDEFNQAKEPGNYGWPFYVGDNQPFYAPMDSTSIPGPYFKPANPLNLSSKNTGLRDLPPARKPLIAYRYALSEEYPLLGSGGRSAVGGPVFRRADYPGAARPFPAYYEGKWFITDFMRGWIMVVAMDERGSFSSMEKFLLHENFGSAIDMKFSPDGDLYVLEYGTSWLQDNDNARLVRIVYNAGNRKPIVEISADKYRGAIPMHVKLSSAGTMDYDKDSLRYEWTITSSGESRVLKQPHPEITLKKPGKYQARLTVRDSYGNSSSRSMELVAGNDPPVVRVDFSGGNQTFFFRDDTLHYAIEVIDREDGSLADGRVKTSQVSFYINYMPMAYDVVISHIAKQEIGMKEISHPGSILIKQQDCQSCHTPDKKSIGPSYRNIAGKYQKNGRNTDTLVNRIIRGGSGVWGNFAMSAHPELSRSEARSIVDYILSSADTQKTKTLPLKGMYHLAVPEKTSPYGSFVMRAFYQDKGAGTVPPSPVEAMYILRFPVLYPEKAEYQKNTRQIITPAKEFFMESDSGYFGFKRIDLTHIREISVSAFAVQWTGAAGGVLECRIDSPDGKLVGQTRMIEVLAEKKKTKELIPIGSLGISGKHDIYFIARNSSALPYQPLFQVSSVEFKK